MTRSSLRRIFLPAAIPVLLLIAIAGCRSRHVDIMIENKTGAQVQLLEVDYPDASFGTDNLATGADFHYRIQVQGSGPLKIQYTASGGHQVQITGPNLLQGQQGQLQIVLLPSGKADFHPQLTPAN